MQSKRTAPIDINKSTFQKVGYELIDTIAEFMDTIDRKPITKGESPTQLQEFLGISSLPANGTPIDELMSATSKLLIEHSLFNGHPKFLGYITSSAAPAGALADMLASTVNSNCGAHILSPMATEIERQTVQWLAEFIGVSPEYGGLLVSGGNMANFTAFLAARTTKGSATIKENGVDNSAGRMLVYCSKTTHTWIEKAVILFGMGTSSIRWIPTDNANRMDNKVLEETIKKDLRVGYKPIMVIGTAGDVSTGIVDDLDGIANLCKAYKLWFHIDGAYGVPAAIVPEMKKVFKGIERADSIALDPHKWLYSPLEAGCTLVKNPQHLVDTFSSHPEYYNFKNDEQDFAQNFFEYGLQNSRGFRALKVWMILQQVGRSGYVKMIGDDIALAEYLFELAKKHTELEAITHNLSISTLRYIPADLKPDALNQKDYLNQLNEAVVNELQAKGQAFLSNAIVNDMYCLRGCIVNFRTSKKDIEEIIDIIVQTGNSIHQKLKK